MSISIGDTSPYRRLCAAVILCAAKDAAGRGEGDQAHATAWLASSRASLFFEPLNFTQSAWLARSPWRVWAGEALPEATEADTRVILDGLAYLSSLDSLSNSYAPASPQGLPVERDSGLKDPPGGF